MTAQHTTGSDTAAARSGRQQWAEGLMVFAAVTLVITGPLLVRGDDRLLRVRHLGAVRGRAGQVRALIRPEPLQPTSQKRR